MSKDKAGERVKRCPCGAVLKRKNELRQSRCLNCSRELLRQYFIDKPWMRSRVSAQKRCGDKNHRKYPLYGGRGIKYLLTIPQMKSLWIRDNAAAMKDPTLDRLDPDGHYVPENCRFIERAANSALARRKGGAAK